MCETERVLQVRNAPEEPAKGIPFCCDSVNFFPATRERGQNWKRYAFYCYNSFTRDAYSRFTPNPPSAWCARGEDWGECSPSGRAGHLGG
jgi:hypothetical protein